MATCKDIAIISYWDKGARLERGYNSPTLSEQFIYPMSDYDFRSIEAEAQAYWQAYKVFEVDEDADKEPFYCLSMLPYPSGRLHMGHVRNYTIGDVISRFQMMRGKNVLQPMGWDAFGLPAENAAIDNKQHPAKWTYANIADMKKQLHKLGFAIDWRREFATCTPEYYRWEQLFFLHMYQADLVYRKESFVNWDPVEQTVLANEQVEDGRGWRSKALIERKLMPQWCMRISKYADELLSDLDNLDDWPQLVLAQQRNWIGKSSGMNIRFQVADSSAVIEVFTTRPDTICGVSYIALALEHPLAQQQAATNPELAEFIAECGREAIGGGAQAKAEKKGMATSLYAINPVNGTRVAVWVSNYVLMQYGFGAVMGVPAHDERDYEFAHQEGLEILWVVRPSDADSSWEQQQSAAYTEPGVLINSGAYNGLDFASACQTIAADLVAKQSGEVVDNFRLRDWGVSRQRYWGCPVPMIHCPDCGIVPVPEDQLPVVLPEDVLIDGRGNALDKHDEFVNTTCPRCQGAAKRDTDTFDTFVESSWYYARYCCSDQHEAMLDERALYWLPVSQYIGGVEHAVLHLLYARFFYKVMRDILRDAKGKQLVTSDEPFPRLLAQGMVLAEVYYREANGETTFFAPSEVKIHSPDGKSTIAVSKADGKEVCIGRRKKMSKSSKNGVDPDQMIQQYGADAVRLYMMFTSPPQQSFEWSQTGLEGSARFLRRFYRLCSEAIANCPSSTYKPSQLTEAAVELWRKLNQTLAKVSDDIDRRYTFNTAIAAIMELMNTLSTFVAGNSADKALARDVAEKSVLMLAPIAPHLCHYLWNSLGGDTPVHKMAYPQIDAQALQQNQYQLAVQVNGKLRATLALSSGSTQAEVEQQARAAVGKYLSTGELCKTIYVPERIVNFVVK